MVWTSPITTDLIVSATIGLATVVIDNKDIYWLESRPTEGGRNVLVKYTSLGEVVDITPQPYNVRSRVHEYGGSAFVLVDGVIYFSNFSDGGIYKQNIEGEVKPLLVKPKFRFADFIIDSHNHRLIAVCEDHSIDNSKEPKNYLVSIDINTGDLVTLAEGYDFYSSPRLSPDGKLLSYLTWNHPNMPWDNTQLWLATLNSDGLLGDTQLLAGGENESIVQPEWSPDGMLYYSSDRTGWWNLYRRDTQGKIDLLLPMEAEFGYPHWVFGESMYGFVDENTIICTYTQNGKYYLASLDIKSKQLHPIETEFTTISHLRVSNNQVVFIAASPTQVTSVVRLDIKTLTTEILKKSSDITIDEGYISIPSAYAFPTENGLTAYAWFYPPQNKDYNQADYLPPLIIKSHGGPTTATSNSLNLKIQYWTSRGFAICDVNYGGSTGYGRAYRERLKQNWGIVDVDDCVNAAKYLVQEGKVDGKKLAIAGGSAGGYTTLAALTFRDTFCAGASYYGISDLEALAIDTHKFESRYLDSLIGVYPQKKELYYQRSPINFTEKLSTPIIFFQGLEDKVVPPNQAEMMVEALKAKGLPVAYVAYPDEQHGFRRAENIKKSLDGELYFYCRIFAQNVEDNIQPVEIFNLPT